MALRWLAVLVAVILLGACAGTDLTPPAPVKEPVVADPSGLRRTAGLPDCVPTAGAEFRPVRGGLPDLVLNCLGGDRPVALTSLRGPVLVNLWATWCAPCRTEGPYLATVAEAAKGRLTMVGIDTVDPDPGAAADFAKGVGWSYMQLQDPGHKVSDALGLKGLPITLFVDASGTIVYRHVGGFTSVDQIRELVRSHLGVVV